MGKGVGFNRNIRLKWMEAVAGHRIEGHSPEETRKSLDRILAETLHNAEGRRKSIDVLMRIWFHSGKIAPALYEEALTRFAQSPDAETHIWLHYGLTLLAYPYFRDVASIVGRLIHRGERVSIALVRKFVLAERGNMAAVADCVSRVLFALCDWGLLERIAGRRSGYIARAYPFTTEDISLQTWLLACALKAHPGESVPLLDLLRLPELFSFRFSVGAMALRQSPYLRIERQGGEWDAVWFVDTPHP